MIYSSLDSIVGVGPKKKQKLISKFGSLKGIAQADITDLISVPGITKELAIIIKQSV